MAIWLEVLWVWMTLYSDDARVSFSRPDGQQTIQHIHQLILNMILMKKNPKWFGLEI